MFRSPQGVRLKPRPMASRPGFAGGRGSGVTEWGWLNSDSPESMLTEIRSVATDRELRLFAIACARRLWELLPNGRVRQIVELAEQCVEGITHVGELVAAAYPLLSGNESLCEKEN